MRYQFDWSVLWGQWGILLLKGLAVTVELSLLILFCAFTIGFVIGTIRWARIWFLEPLCWIYVEFTRNTPPLVQILFWYFSAVYILPHVLFDYMRSVGFQFAAAAFALSLYHGAFVAESVRAGLNAVGPRQDEAARALGMTFAQRVVYVILPQAFPILVPPLTNEAVSLAKNTSLAMAIGVAEIAYQTKYIDTYTFRGVEVLVASSVLYVVVCLTIEGLGHLARWLLTRDTSQAPARRTAIIVESA
jgi:polar amino acid transport system permease protein